ncbi:hypothetical protein SJ05684_c31580 [Sinorhizobium sojae CCBAU 05684]|uniref:Uncharacterized protein n=1 Tax=Sinorhizobium sojae CCBAU 05684 TaxID=716928 RepID=A0A249PFQ6_9HYPH|nr:hypothetical protein SJ05684_c31580 [Sinorhizobium sojae CCBAU 05684]
MLEDGLLRPHRIRRHARVTVWLTANGGRVAIAGRRPTVRRT